MRFSPIQSTSHPKQNRSWGILERFRFGKVLVLALFLLFPVLTSPAAPTLPQVNVTLAWDPSPSTNVVGYALYWGTLGSRIYTETVYTKGLSVTLTNLWRGLTYYFAATAIDEYGLESDYSVELVYTPPAPPAPPTLLRIVEPGRLTILYQSSDLVNWSPVMTNAAPSGSFRVPTDQPAAFFQIGTN